MCLILPAMQKLIKISNHLSLLRPLHQMFSYRLAVSVSQLMSESDATTLPLGEKRILHVLL